MDTYKPRQPGQVLLDTKGMGTREAFTRWQELLFDTLPLVQVVQAVGNRKKEAGCFEARAYLQFVGESALLSGSFSHDFTMRHLRGKTEISRSHADSINLFLHNYGVASSEFANQPAHRLAPSGWSLLSSADTYQATWNPGRSSAIALTIPAKNFSDRGVGIDIFGRHMTPDRPLNRLVANYIQALASGGEIGGAASGKAVVSNLVDLIALAVNAPDSRETSRAGLASGLLLVLTQFLDAHYMQPDVSPALAARHAGITPRHVHRLFERTGTTFGEQVYRRRLHRAQQMLRDPLHAGRRITDIAYECGFASAAHFVRRYRELFGESPSETRGKR